MKKQKKVKNKKEKKTQKSQVKQVATNNSFLRVKIEELQQEIEVLENISHNVGVDSSVKHFREKLVEKATPAELKFKHIAELKHLNLHFQHRINIMNGSRIEKVYYADFCDVKYKLIFEIDGDYHTTPEQIKLDNARTRQLTKAGYKVFRITNEEVFEGKATSFLYKAYRSIGVSI